MEKIKKQQLINWEAKLNPTHNKGRVEAVRLAMICLALNCGTNALELRKARIVPTMQRILQPEFPPELLIQVVEAYVYTQALRWHVGWKESLDKAVDRLFAWPTGEQQTPADIRQLANVPLLNHAIIELRAMFAPKSNYKSLTIPNALEGNEQHIRHMVLDLEVVPHMYNRELERARGAMGGLALQFANLETCVLTVIMAEQQNSVELFASNNSGLVTPLASLLGGPVPTKPLKPTLIDLIDSLAAKGPGKRKFVRFTHQIGPRACVRPLVDVSRFKQHQAQTGASATGGKHIFDRAYTESRMVRSRYIDLSSIS